MSSSTTTARHHASQSLVPLVVTQPKWKRSVKSTDTEPAFTQNKDQFCQVCHECESRYTCPKCHLPYCSVACYKEHDQDAASCTESFYQDRVSTVLNYESKEQRKSIQQILARSHEQMLTASHEQENEDMSEEDLWRLAEALENDAATDEDALRLLTPELRMAFERAVENGELNEVLEPWYPWWMPELVSTANVTDLSHSSTPKRTLDERLIKIPSFRTLRSGSHVPVLTYNAVDLLYSIASTLRLYHGVDNAIAVCRDSCQTLIQSSAVLCDDARYSSVAEALMACTTVDSSIPTNKSNIPWTILANDVSYLLSSPRHMAHALMEAMDILKAAAKEFKKEGEIEEANKMRRIKKKLEYYLSWSRETIIPDELDREIREWIEEWSGLIDNESDTLVLPNADEQRRRPGKNEIRNRRTDPPSTDSLMTKVSSRRKDNDMEAT